MSQTHVICREKGSGITWEIGVSGVYSRNLSDQEGQDTEEGTAICTACSCLRSAESDTAERRGSHSHFVLMSVVAKLGFIYRAAAQPDVKK